jgi:hypothetical protein
LAPRHLEISKNTGDEVWWKQHLKEAPTILILEFKERKRGGDMNYWGKLHTCPLEIPPVMIVSFITPFGWHQFLTKPPHLSTAGLSGGRKFNQNDNISIFDAFFFVSFYMLIKILFNSHFWITTLFQSFI